MMKKISIKAILSILALMCVGCGGPKIIPDDELAQIFSEAYIHNAYLNAFARGYDTLDIYTPIWERYGYTEEDIRFSIGNFSKRKSAKLSDVVDQAIRIIEKEKALANHKMAVRDTLREIGRRRFVKTVHYDTLLRVRRIADTAGLIIRIPIREKGDFEVTYSYVVDSADKNHNMRTRHYILNTYDRKVSENIHRMRRNEQRGHYKGNFKVTAADQYLVLDLNPYTSKDITSPKMRIDSLEVRFFMDDKRAQDSLSRLLLRKTIPENYQRLIKPWQDSVARRDSVLRAVADSIRLAEDSLRVLAIEDSLRVVADSLCLNFDSLRNATINSTIHADTTGVAAK
jgi:hypothetical protein